MMSTSVLEILRIPTEIMTQDEENPRETTHMMYRLSSYSDTDPFRYVEYRNTMHPSKFTFINAWRVGTVNMHQYREVFRLVRVIWLQQPLPKHDS